MLNLTKTAMCESNQVDARINYFKKFESTVRRMVLAG